MKCTSDCYNPAERAWLIAFACAAIFMALTGCAYNSPGAKINVSPTTNASLTPASVLPASL